MSDFKPVILIPVYNHGKACSKLVDDLAPYCRSSGIQIILVDDGNASETKTYLEQTAARYSDFVILTGLKKNSGKGGAFKKGIIEARERGFTHALQLDADGQHDWTRAEYFFKTAQEKPDSLLCGYPEYDESVPSHRKNGRKFANTWCAVVTWQGGIKDSMCGFRVYPVEKTYKYLTSHRIDMRMGFDIEVLVRLIWSGMPFAFYPVKVTYPSDGISNFHVVRDNIRISWVFTKLCTGMLLRVPLLLWRKLHGKR